MQAKHHPTTNNAAPSAASREAHQRAGFASTAQDQTITAKVVGGVTYYTTTRRGVEYTAYTLRGEWVVLTRRLALGRLNPGGCKYFTDIKLLCENVKAFSGLDLLI